MTAELIWHPQAREDLLEIYVTIGFDNPEAAERFYTTVEAKVDGLTHHPRLGPRRPDIRPATRMLVEGPYLILYETRPNTDEGPIAEVDIVRVVDGRRDLTKPF
jgi:toxin ParE1/3/4